MADADAAIEDAGSGSLEALEELRRRPTDAARPQAVARQCARGARTARERIDGLADPGSFREYGVLARAAEAGLDTPADGIVTGIARLRDRPFAVASYDYTVLAGSQGDVSNTKLARVPRSPTGWPR